jgi:hypothetical protein
MQALGIGIIPVIAKGARPMLRQLKVWNRTGNKRRIRCYRGIHIRKCEIFRKIDRSVQLAGCDLPVTG